MTKTPALPPESSTISPPASSRTLRTRNRVIFQDRTRSIVRKFVCLLFAAALAVACQKPASTPASSTTPAAAAPGAATPAKPEPAKPVPAVLPEVIADCNGDKIPKAEFENAVRSVEQRAGGAVPPEKRDELYRGVLEDLVAYRLLKQEVKQRQMTVSDAEVDARIAAFKQQAGSEANFKEMLQAQQVTEAKLRDDARSDLLVNKLLEQEVNQKMLVKPSDIATFYEKNPDRFQQGESMRASHILVIVPAERGRAGARGAEGARRSGAQGRQGRPGLREARAAVLAGLQRAARRRPRASSPRARWCRPSMRRPSRSRRARSATWSRRSSATTSSRPPRSGRRVSSRSSKRPAQIQQFLEQRAAPGEGQGAGRPAQGQGQGPDLHLSALSRWPTGDAPGVDRTRRSHAVRLDVWLDVSCLFKTRSEAQRACKGGKVEVNGQPGKPHRLVRAGDEIVISRPFGVRQSVVIRGAGRALDSKGRGAALYDDRTPQPSAEEIATRRAERVFRAAQAAAGRPDKRQRRAVQKLRGY